MNDPAATAARAQAVLGILAAPGSISDLAQGLARELEHALRARFPEIDWLAHVETDATDVLVDPPVADDELVDAARRRMLTRGWDLCVCLTDLPLHVGRRPVIAHGAPLHGVGLICVPALGAVGVRRRLQEAVLRLVDALLGEADDARDAGRAGRARRLEHRLQQLIDRAPQADSDGAVRYTARVLSGHAQLLVGMIRANRPWRLAARLSRASGAAAATGVFALVTSDVWRLADTLDVRRLCVLGFVSVAVIAAALIAGAGLWEHPAGPRAREQAVLFNIATTATVLIGIGVFYVGLFAVALPAAALLVTPDALAHALGHHAGVGTYVRLAWFACSLATLGGALGAWLETHEAVRHAAYTYRTSRATESDRTTTET
jgi:hypothetical protein